jgi:hypothetical protein
MHRMTKKQADGPAIDVGLGGFGEQQATARFQHAPEFGQRALLFHQMVKRLVAENDVDAGIRQRHVGAVTGDQLGDEPFALQLGARQTDTVRVGIQPDHSLRFEDVVQVTERLALSTARVQPYAALRHGLADEFCEVVDRHPQHVVFPGKAAQETKTDAGVPDVRRAGEFHEGAIVREWQGSRRGWRREW